MQISETAFKKLPGHLKHLFKKLPNLGSEEVLAGFPDSNGSGSARILKRGKRDDDWGMADAPGALRDAGTGSAARFFYCAKASRGDRNDGLEDPGPQFKRGATLRNAENLAKADLTGNNHPTVKPTDLMRYLCRLVTPPGGTVLDPFMGSGSTGRGAVLEGFDFIGIEREAEYVEIARARIAAVEASRNSQSDVGRQMVFSSAAINQEVPRG